MPTPASGNISFSNIASIIKNSTSAQVSLGESDTRYLLGVTSGQISMSSAYNKPTAGNSGTTYYTAGTYTFYVPAYKTLSAQVAGGGSGGRGGSGCAFYPYIGCFNCSGGGAGGTGGASSFLGITASGGVYGGSNGGSGGTVTTNGGGAGGGAGGGYAFCASGGSNGTAGGRVDKTYTKAVDGPDYNQAVTITVGGGGAGSYNAGGTGGTGWVYLAWS